MSEWQKGIKKPPRSKEHCQNIAKSKLGSHLSEEIKQKISKTLKGRKQKPCSEATKWKLSNALKGRKVRSGWHHSETSKQKISKSSKGKKCPWVNPPHFRGTEHYNWQGGKSFEPYGVDWTESLRRTIRERDHYRCQLCGEPQGDRAHSIHHIDYCKTNNNPNNLITLCNNCHVKTNFNRKYWIKYFRRL